MRRALALPVVLLTAAAHPTTHGGQQIPVTVVRAVIVSGTPQSAHAYAAVAEKKYYAEFPHTLLVRWSGPPSRDGSREVQFTCITKGCSFLPTDQPEHGELVDRVPDADDAYDAKVVNGQAALRVTVKGDTLGTYTIRAEPIAYRRERAVPTFFRLTLR